MAWMVEVAKHKKTGKEYLVQNNHLEGKIVVAIGWPLNFTSREDEVLTLPHFGEHKIFLREFFDIRKEKLTVKLLRKICKEEK